MAWQASEPVRGSQIPLWALHLTGLERMRDWEPLGLPNPPIHHLLGLRPLSASPAAVTFTMPTSRWLSSGADVFFAGTAALVADAPLSSAVLTAVGPGQVVATSDLTISYLRPVDVSSERLIARARPIEVGRSLGLAEALVEDAHGRLVAHATTRCFITSVELPPPAPFPPPAPRPTYDTPDPYQRPVPEPAFDPATWDRLTFLEVIAAQRSGDLPLAPFARLFALDRGEASPGRFACDMPASPWFTSPAPTVYGGVLAYAMDTALTGAVSSTLSTTETAAPLDLKVQFLRPVLPDGRPLRVEGEVTHRGRTLAAAQGRITNADGKVVVLASSSAAIRAGRGWSSFAVADHADPPGHL